MRHDDDYYYAFSDYSTSDHIEAADIKECKNGMRTVYYYTCWDCGKQGTPHTMGRLYVGGAMGGFGIRS